MRSLPSFARASFATVLCAGAAFASGEGPVRVGGLSLDGAELSRRLGIAAASGELAALSKDEGVAKLRFVERVVVPELLFRAEAERLALQKKPAFAARENDVLFLALSEAERRAEPAPSPGDVEAYYAAHRADFTRPRRLRLWRILVSTEAEAKKLLGDVQGAGGPERWREASRKISKDGATRERGGDLGFVHPDGFTDVPELRVDKALFAAADEVDDGALVPEPVREGSDFAVVWRRGSLTEASVPLDAARPTIVRLLLEERTAKRIDALAAELAKSRVSAKNPALVEQLEVPDFR